MRRRELLTTSVVAMGGLAGCLNRLPLVGMTPEEVVTEFYEAQFDMDINTANSHLHRESSIEKITERDAKRRNVNDYSLISVTNVNTQPKPEEFFLNESEVERRVDNIQDVLDDLGGEEEHLQSEINRYKNGTTPQVATVSDITEVEATLDFKENGRRRRPTRTIHLIKDGDGWKIWTINTE